MSETMTVEINLEFTPNPNTLKYTLNRRLLVVGAENYNSKEEADMYSPLASKLFDIEPIQGVMIGPDFITVTLSSQDNLRATNKSVMDTIKEHLASGADIATPRDDDQKYVNLSDDEKRIKEILDSEIRPAVANDGGDIIFERYADDIVYLTMFGACAGCPSATVTLKQGIQSRLQQEFPNITDVVAVNS
jgi:Fe-S cluster biogenesis protein NfuA